jgi:hypothetical protein
MLSSLAPAGPRASFAVKLAGAARTSTPDRLAHGVGDGPDGGGQFGRLLFATLSATPGKVLDKMNLIVPFMQPLLRKPSLPSPCGESVARGERKPVGGEGFCNTLILQALTLTLFRRAREFAVGGVNVYPSARFPAPSQIAARQAGDCRHTIPGVTVHSPLGARTSRPPKMRPRWPRSQEQAGEMNGYIPGPLRR